MKINSRKVANTGPLVDIEDAISRMPRYTQESVDAADELDEFVRALCRPAWLPFKIVWRWNLEAMRQKTYNLLNRVVVTGTAWRIISHDRRLEDEW